MENLSLEDRPQGGTSQQSNVTPTPPPGPPMVPQLPPQMFTTAAQLLDLTDKKLMVVLRDGRKLTGVLRSWDQFANLVLQNTAERVFADKFYADIKHGPGLYIVRGENVLLLGEIDLDQEDAIPAPFQETSEEKVKELQRLEADKRKKKEKNRAQLLRAYGFEGDMIGDAIL